MARLAKPVLVTVTFWAALVVLTICAAKVSAAGATATPGTATAVPDPESAMLCGEPGALLAMVILPLTAATVSGVKVMLKVQLPAAANDGVSSGQVLVKPKLPLPVMLLIVSGPVPLLVRVTVVGGLVVLTVRVPKLTEVGVRVTPGVGAAVTVRVAVLATALLPVEALKPPAGKVKT